MSSRIDEIKERHYAIRLTDGREICFQCVDELRPGLVADWPCEIAHLLAELARVTSERDAAVARAEAADAREAALIRTGDTLAAAAQAEMDAADLPSTEGPPAGLLRTVRANWIEVRAALAAAERACHCGRPVSVAPRDLCGACIEFDTDTKCYVGRAAPEGKG